jgi:transcriptional regulator GlxA family with amidase domain
VCTGAFLLAATGLIDGATVATHWAYADELAQAYPAVRVDGKSIYRHEGRLWTSAGVTAGIDLALAMVEDDHDAELAHLLASWLVVFLRRPGGQRQFARAASGPAAPHPGVADAQRFIDEHLDEELRIDTIAEAVGMSPRNFGRVFRRVTGLTPGAYVQQRRLDVARDLLERTDEPLRGVARRCGLGSTETLRRVMHDQVGVSPEAYRRRFAHQPDRPTQ